MSLTPAFSAGDVGTVLGQRFFRRFFRFPKISVLIRQRHLRGAMYRHVTARGLLCPVLKENRERFQEDALQELRFHLHKHATGASCARSGPYWQKPYPFTIKCFRKPL